MSTSRSSDGKRVGRFCAALGAAFLSLGVSAVQSQDILPHLAYAFPAGGRQGSTLRVVVGGKYLDGLQRVDFTGGGVEGKLIEEVKPLSSDEAGALRKKLSELKKTPREKRDEKLSREIAGLERQVANYLSETTRRRMQPAMDAAMAIEVTIAEDAEPGLREMRFETRRGLSNPIRFVVGTLPEFIEDPPGLTPEAKDFPSPLRFPPKVTTDITVPAVANGQIIPREPDYVHWQARHFTPGDADRYRFQARKGQRLVISVAARELIPYLADAVPGWFQATLTVFDAKGNELAYNDDYRFQPDPVLLFEVPDDGQYVVEIKDAISRGRPDFVYRMTVAERPYITGIFPLGGPAGVSTEVQLAGWNLPSDRVVVESPEATSATIPLSVRKGNIASNSVPFAVNTLPEEIEQEPNDSASSAQPTPLPIIVNGRIDRPGDWDVFRIEGHAGQPIVAEVTARRLASPLDSILELTDASGHRLAFNDDHDDKADALNTHQADSLIETTLPADGLYFLRLGDAQSAGGQEYAYRLRIGPPRPDFELRVTPSAINAVSWQLEPVTIFALRKDGFDGEIDLAFQGDPAGVLMDSGRIPAGEDKVRVTLAVGRWLLREPVHLCLEGRAVIGGREVVRSAVPAEDMMQAFAYRHLVPTESLTLLLPGSGNRPDPPEDPRSFRSNWSLLGELPVKIPAGGSAQVQAGAPWDATRGEIQVELSDPPPGIAIGSASCTDRVVTIELRCDAEQIATGRKGNLIANGFQKRTQTNNEGKTREFRTFLGPLPAIPYEIVEP